MGRYRKVEVRTWGDEKFQALSPIPPCGQGLWLYLMVGPHTGPIPGLFKAGRASMAEDLGWSLDAFDKVFDEAFRQGMVKGDFRSRVVWLPNAIKHNKPESPNVVRSWGGEFDLIPECDLKRQAFEALRSNIHALGEAFAKAFDEAFKKPSAKPFGKASSNQEQEQEQEQEQNYPLYPPCRGEQPGDSRKTPQKRNRTSAEVATLTDWISGMKAKGEKPVSDYAAVWRYAEEVGLPTDWVQLSWMWFVDRYSKDEKGKRKRYKDWRGVFLRAVKEGWPKYWYWSEKDGGYRLTTAGVQADNEIREAA